MVQLSRNKLFRTETVASDNRVIESILSATVELDSGYILRL